MTTTIVKPGTKKGYVVLVPSAETAVPTITLQDGTVIKGQYLNNNEGRKQYVFPTTLYDQENLTLTVGSKTQKLAGGRQAYEGEGVGGLKTRDKGSINSAGVIVGGDGTAADGNTYGVAPKDISGQFPTATQLKGTPYNFTDPQVFAEKFAGFNQMLLQSDARGAKKFALDTLDTELQGLKGFAPAAASLKRDLINTDNVFNQAERTRQLQTTVPDVLKDLDKQAEDARSYASGRAPDAILDRGLELSSRAASADMSASGGFGSQSSAARGVSDLMSARERIGLSQYGNQLLSQNAEQRAALRLAPTEYSNAGSSINVNPTVSGSQLQQSYFESIKQATVLSPESALSSNVQQNQYVTTTGNQIGMFNVENLNNFALSLFNYKVGLESAIAGAGQTDINTKVAIDQQNKAAAAASDARTDTQTNNEKQTYIQAGTQLLTTAAIVWALW